MSLNLELKQGQKNSDAKTISDAVGAMWPGHLVVLILVSKICTFLSRASLPVSNLHVSHSTDSANYTCC